MHLKPETAPTTVVCVIYIKIGKSEGGISIHRKTTRRQRLKESPEKKASTAATTCSIRNCSDILYIYFLIKNRKWNLIVLSIRRKNTMQQN